MRVLRLRPHRCQFCLVTRLQYVHDDQHGTELHDQAEAGIVPQSEEPPPPPRLVQRPIAASVLYVLHLFSGRRRSDDIQDWFESCSIDKTESYFKIVNFVLKWGDREHSSP